MIEKSRITMERSLDANDIVIVKEADEILDTIALKVIQNDLPDFLLPIRSLNINNKTELRYEMGNKLSLKYKDLDFNKAKFLQFCMDLLMPFMECGDWFLDYHYICVDEDFVFVDKARNKVQFLYIPLSDFRNSDDEIIHFMKTILNKVSLSDGNDFLVKLYQAFGRGNIVLKEIYEMIKEEFLHSSSQPIKEYKEQNINVSRMNYDNSAELQQRPMKNPSTPVQVKPVQESQTPVNTNATPSFLTKEEKKMEKQEAASKLKKEGFLSGFLGKKEENVNSPIVSEKVVANSETSEEQDVLNALFGSGKKEKPKKEKKVKEEKVKVNKEKTVKEKSSGLFGFLKKEKEESSVSSPFANPKPAPTPINQPSYEQVNRDRASFNYDYTEVDSDEGSDVTMIMNDEPSFHEASLILLDKSLVGLPERINLGFRSDRIIIGRRSKDTKQPDVAFDSSFNRVGRMHACIQKEGEMFYLVDLGSANGTLLNGEVLIPNKQYPLRNEDVIGFVVAHPIKYKVVL